MRRGRCSRFSRVALFSALVCLFAFTAFDSIASAQQSSPPAAAAQRVRVYLFRGFAGLVFSRGTDKLAEELEKAGFTATVNEAVMCPIVARQAIRSYRRDPTLIAVVGHSLGGACAIKFADNLNVENIPVSFVFTTDPAKIAGDVPPNVERYINVFQSNSLLGGRDVKAAPGFRGHFASFDIAQHSEITHFNMEKDEAIRQQVVTKIQQLAALPPKAEGEISALRYIVPSDAAIELWDSGAPISARGGETLQSLAEFHRLPLWSLAQINPISISEPLLPGQRIIVPRHLVPLPRVDAGVAASEAQLKSKK
jgi:hypothetical protein